MKKMAKLRKLKKRSLYAISMAIALVCSYVFKEQTLSNHENVVKVPQVYADTVPVGAGDVPSSGDGGADDGGDGGGGDGGCFVAGTLISLVDGSCIAIEKIEPGMIVQGTRSAFVVSDKIVHNGTDAFMHDFNTEPLKTILLNNGKSLQTVDGHPIYLRTENGWEWLNVSAIKVGTKLKSQDGGEVTVVNIITRPGERPILYNLELIVEPGRERSFYANGILVRDTQFIEYSINRWIAPPIATSYYGNS